MAFNPPVVDDFNRASLGANYTNLAGTATITSNELAASSAPAVTVYTPESWQDVWAWMQISTLPGVGTNTDLGVRVANIGSILTLTAYGVRYNRSAGTDTVSLIRFDAPVTPVNLVTFNQEISANDCIGIRAYGTNLSAWYRSGGSGNFSYLGETTDGTYTAAGDVSFTLPDTTIRINEWGGGVYVPQPPQVRGQYIPHMQNYRRVRTF